MSNKKKQTTNRMQFTSMVDLMKTEPDIAKGFSKKAPDIVILFWDKLKNQMNSLGPPFKEVSEWKKVWSDHKSALRKKLAHNNQEKTATGGGPNKEIFFTPLEEEVIQLVCLKDCVEGVPTASSFGVPVKRKLNSTSSENSNDLFNEIVESETENDLNISNNLTPKRIPKPIQLLERQINMQEKLYEEISKILSSHNERVGEIHNERVFQALDQIGEHQKKTHRALDRLIDHQKKGNSIQQELVEETKRHNQRMEQYAYEKNQLKQKILQIELSKIGERLDD